MKPPPLSGKLELMDICPACHYTTFTDETFAVCPKCGLVGSEYRENIHKQLKKDQTLRDREVLTRSHRNPDLVAPSPVETIPELSRAPQPIRVLGCVCVVIGGILLLYGLNGLLGYYSKDWQAALSEQLLEPASESNVFFRFGFIPWLITLYSTYFILMVALFLRLRAGSLKRLNECAWMGLVLGIIHEIVDFTKWVEISSSTPSFYYFATGIISSLFWIVLWSIPAILLLWSLKSDTIRREFPEN
jgi:hypothetical protein